MRQLKFFPLVFALSATANADLYDTIRTGLNTVGKGIDSTVSEVKMTNTNIKNETENENSVVIGNSGVEVTADKVEMDNVDIENKTKNTNSVVVGNSGIKAGEK